MNLHYFKRDSYIARWLSSPHSASCGGLEGKAKALVAVTHLALLGVREQEAAFWAHDTEEEGSPFRAALLSLYGFGISSKLFFGRVIDWTETDGV